MENGEKERERKGDKKKRISNSTVSTPLKYDLSK